MEDIDIRWRLYRNITIEEWYLYNDCKKKVKELKWEQGLRWVGILADSGLIIDGIINICSKSK